MLRQINAPTTAVGESKCQCESDLALKPALQKLFDEAEAAGWDRLQSALSVINLYEDNLYGTEHQEGCSYAAPFF